jgi:prepilin-type N-terminal cleavage/methylation domain-containing protein
MKNVNAMTRQTSKNAPVPLRGTPTNCADPSSPSLSSSALTPLAVVQRRKIKKSRSKTARNASLAFKAKCLNPLNPPSKYASTNALLRLKPVNLLGHFNISNQNLRPFQQFQSHTSKTPAISIFPFVFFNPCSQPALHNPPRHILCFTTHRVKTKAQSAFSLVELLVVISIIAILAGLLFSALVSAKARSRQAACINNLHQIGLGFTGFAVDHEGKYPMDLPERLGGSSEYINSLLITNTPFSGDFHHFVALSNEVPNVKIMVCPADRKRRPAENYHTFNSDNLSYWANTRAVPHATLATLAGDWNVSNPSSRTNDWEQINFTQQVHTRKGSVLFADGRVEITRSISIPTPNLPPDIAVTSPPTPAGPPGAERNARPQPNAPVTPAPAPAPSPIQTTSPQSRTMPEEQKTEPVPKVETNQLVKAETLTSSDFPSRRSRRVGVTGSGVEPLKDPPFVDSTPAPGGPGGPAPSDDEPWDTPGFRIFKMFAFVSYLFSLLWAIIMLLILYLRSRMAQREQERASGMNVD